MAVPFLPTDRSVGWTDAGQRVPPRRARARRGRAPRAPPRHLQGVVPPRARAVEPGSRLRRRATSGPPTTSTSPRRSAAPSSSTSSPRTTCPYYFRTIERMFGADSAWGAWARRWTAEEGRHSIVIRDYLTVTRAIDPVAARAGPHGPGRVRRGARARDARRTASPTSPSRSWPPASPTTTPASCSTDKAGYEVMKKVASDENRHYLFYRDLVSAALEVDPSGTVMRHRAAGAQLRDARHRHPRLRGARQGHRQGRHLRLRHPPRPDPRARGAAPLGRSSSSRASTPRPRGPAPPS